MAHGVHNDVVRMKLRVMRAAGAMLEAGDYEIAGGLAVHRSAVADAGGSHMPLNMGHRGPDGLAMRRDQSPVARDLGHDRHRLGRAQGHVPAGAVFQLSVPNGAKLRSEAHTSELQSLMRISYAVFCLKKKK